jgi:hypothetical protein
MKTSVMIKNMLFVVMLCAPYGAFAENAVFEQYAKKVDIHMALVPVMETALRLLSDERQDPNVSTSIKVITVFHEALVNGILERDKSLLTTFVQSIEVPRVLQSNVPGSVLLAEQAVRTTLSMAQVVLLNKFNGLLKEKLPSALLARRIIRMVALFGSSILGGVIHMAIDEATTNDGYVVDDGKSAYANNILLPFFATLVAEIIAHPVALCLQASDFAQPITLAEALSLDTVISPKSELV